jgi:hypothetical protein
MRQIFERLRANLCRVDAAQFKQLLHEVAPDYAPFLPPSHEKETLD